MQPVEDQETKTHPEERQRVTGKGGPVEPLKGKCVESEGLHTGKRKSGFPEDMRGQAVQEDTRQDEVPENS